MVLRLIPDVCNRAFQPGFAHTKGAILNLPSKQTMLRERLMHPLPPISIALISLLRAMPPIKGQSLSANDGWIIGRRSFVLKTQ